MLTLCCHSQQPEDKENRTSWEGKIDSSILEQSRSKILLILNTGSLKDLKGLQQIGDKKAKLILGWRELNGQFTQVSPHKQCFSFCHFKASQLKVLGHGPHLKIILLNSAHYKNLRISEIFQLFALNGGSTSCAAM